MVRLPAAASHKLARVLRAQVGEYVKLFNADGGEWLAELVEVRKSGVIARLVEQTRQPHVPPDIWLAFAPVKKANLDFLVEKATEMGVRRLQPILTDRTENRRIKLDKLAATISDAAEQTERLDVPEIMEPCSLSDLLRTLPEGRPVLAGFERGEAQPLAAVAQDLPADQPPLILTGPEGGFTRAELDLLGQHPAVRPISLGPRILRAETAALAALAVVQSLWGDWGADRPADSFADPD
ncbi:MAG: 16S rRNA (uracil(1498)-N(3))-methyltransferase [Alphaproteobacteria bacterium]